MRDKVGGQGRPELLELLGRQFRLGARQEVRQELCGRIDFVVHTLLTEFRWSIAIVAC